MNDVTLPQILNAHAASLMDGVHISIPGKVVSYDETKQTAVIAPVVRMPRAVGDNVESVEYSDFPTFPDVPVAWPSGGGFLVAMPLVAGDPVMLLFSEVSLAEYLTTGEDSTPADTRKHSAGYPIAIPGGAKPDTKAFADAPTDGVLIGKDGTDLQIKITAAMITLGKAATDFVALGPATDAKLNEIRTELNKVIAMVNGITPGTAIPITPVTGVIATLVKAK